MLIALALLLLMLYRTEGGTAIPFFFLAQPAAIAAIALWAIHEWRNRNPRGDRE
jgi:hypothetical protein